MYYNRRRQILLDWFKKFLVKKLLEQDGKRVRIIRLSKHMRLWVMLKHAGILKFRTICKEWFMYVCKVGDFSPLWLSLDLHITAPREYCLLCLIDPGPTFTFPQTSLHISLYEEIKYLPKGITQCIVSIGEISPSNHNKQLAAYEVRSNFFIKYRFCQHAWYRFRCYISFLQFFHRWENAYFQMATNYKFPYILVILLCLSAGLISTLPNYPTSLKWNEILAFVLILFELMVHLVYEVLS